MRLSGIYFLSAHVPVWLRIGPLSAFLILTMNIWGYSEDGIEELALANPSAIQALRSLISKLEQSAARDE